MIRTLDPLHPMQVRYQAALRPDMDRIISEHLPFLPASLTHFQSAHGAIKRSFYIRLAGASACSSAFIIAVCQRLGDFSESISIKQDG